MHRLKNTFDRSCYTDRELICVATRADHLHAERRAGMVETGRDQRDRMARQGDR